MGLLDRLFKTKEATTVAEAPTQQRNFGGGYGGTIQTNLLSDITNVHKETELMSVAVAHRCMSVVADTVASLAGSVYKSKTEQPNHNFNKLWWRSPNNLYNSFVLKRQLLLNYQNLGNGFAVIMRDTKGRTVSIEIRRALQVIIHENEKYYYDVQNDVVYEDQDVIHLVNIGTNPYLGLSKLQQHAMLFGKSKASLEYVNKVYTNNMFLGGVIQYPENVKLQPETIGNISEQAKIKYGGLDKAGGLFVLDQGGILKQFENTMPLSDAEYVMSERLTNEDICRIYGVPPFMAFEYNKMSGESMEAAKITFVESTVLPIVTQLEQELTNKVFRYEPNTLVKHNIKSLLRADIKSQADYWSKMTSIGKYTINELREMDDQPPVEGGDESLIQANNYFPLSQLAKLAEAMIAEKMAQKDKTLAEEESIKQSTKTTNETSDSEEE